MSQQRFEYSVCSICHQHSVWIGECRNPHCGDDKRQYDWSIERAKATADSLMKVFGYKRLKQTTYKGQAIDITGSGHNVCDVCVQRQSGRCMVTNKHVSQSGLRQRWCKRNEIKEDK